MRAVGAGGGSITGIRFARVRFGTAARIRGVIVGASRASLVPGSRCRAGSSGIAGGGCGRTAGRARTLTGRPRGFLVLVGVRDLHLGQRRHLEREWVDEQGGVAVGQARRHTAAAVGGVVGPGFGEGGPHGQVTDEGRESVVGVAARAHASAQSLIVRGRAARVVERGVGAGRKFAER